MVDDDAAAIRHKHRLIGLGLFGQLGRDLIVAVKDRVDSAMLGRAGDDGRQAIGEDERKSFLRVHEDRTGDERRDQAIDEAHAD